MCLVLGIGNVVSMLVVVKGVCGIWYLWCCDYREYGSGCMVSMENIVVVALVCVEEKTIVMIL